YIGHAALGVSETGASLARRIPLSREKLITLVGDHVKIPVIPTVPLVEWKVGPGLKTSGQRALDLIKVLSSIMTVSSRSRSHYIVDPNPTRNRSQHPSSDVSERT